MRTLARLVACVRARGAGLQPLRSTSILEDGAERHRHRRLCQPPAAPATKTKFNEAVALLHSFWFAESRAIVRERPQGRSGLRHRLLGHRAHPLGQPVRGLAAAADDCHRQGRHRQGPGDRHADRAREGLPRRGGHSVQQRRRDHAAAARARLRDAPCSASRRPTRTMSRRASSGRWRSRRRHRRPTRPTRRQSAGGGNSRADVREAAESPRPGALHHPCLRRAGAGAESAEGRERLRAALRRPCRTRCICRRIRSPASATGSNRSTATSSRRTIAEKTNGIGEAMHARDYMTYAYLQMGMDAQAKAQSRARDAPRHHDGWRAGRGGRRPEYVRDGGDSRALRDGAAAVGRGDGADARTRRRTRPTPRRSRTSRARLARRGPGSPTRRRPTSRGWPRFAIARSR